MKKTIFALCVLILLCAFVFAGCGKDDMKVTTTTNIPAASTSDGDITLPKKENGEIDNSTSGNGVVGDIASDISTGIADMSSTMSAE
ncbi:MAG: hypothetical protein GX051_06095 [Clostridiales bacterium]|nr:hypothetical protein [Clostridiales bacterium]